MQNHSYEKVDAAINEALDQSRIADPLRFLAATGLEGAVQVARADDMIKRQDSVTNVTLQYRAGVNIYWILPDDGHGSVVVREYLLDTDNYVSIKGEVPPRDSAHYVTGPFKRTRKEGDVIYVETLYSTPDRVNSIMDRVYGRTADQGYPRLREATADEHNGHGHYSSPAFNAHLAKGEVLVAPLVATGDEAFHDMTAHVAAINSLDLQTFQDAVSAAQSIESEPNGIRKKQNSDFLAEAFDTTTAHVNYLLYTMERGEKLDLQSRARLIRALTNVYFAKNHDIQEARMNARHAYSRIKTSIREMEEVAQLTSAYNDSSPGLSS